MKTLPEVLHEALRVLNDKAHVQALNEFDVVVVVIERGDHPPLAPGSSAYQIRLRNDGDVDLGLDNYRCEVRCWLGEQWSTWDDHRGWLGAAGFDINDVLATDWRMIPTLSADIQRQIAELRATQPYDGRRVTLCERRGGWRFQGLTGTCAYLAADRSHMVLVVEHDPEGHWPVGMEILADLDHETVPQFHTFRDEGI